MTFKQTDSGVQMPGFESGYLLAMQSWESYLTSLSLHVCHLFELFWVGLIEVRYPHPEHSTENAVSADDYY